MRALILGASGATGTRVVAQLLDRGVSCRVVLRPSAVFPSEWSGNPLVEFVVGSIAEMGLEDNLRLVSGCNVVVSCLGHNISVRGMFGKPRDLVHRSLRHICDAINLSDCGPVKIIWMSTVAVQAMGGGERRSFAERLLLALLGKVLPPQSDNVAAAKYLTETIGANDPKIEWVLVRPDTLTNSTDVGDYTLSEAIVRSPVFDPGATCRSNIGHFMARLVVEPEVWMRWKGRMPAIYDAPVPGVSAAP